MRNCTVWAGVFGVERSTVIEGMEFDDDDELCQARCAGYDLGEGRRRWRAPDVGLYRAYFEADAPQVTCPAHGVVVA